MGSHVERRTGVSGAVAATIMRPGILGMARILYGLDLDVLAPERAVAAIGSMPLLLVHGGSDRVIPPRHAALLKAQAAEESSELWILDGSAHVEGVSLSPCHLDPSPRRAAFLERVVSFLDAAL